MFEPTDMTDTKTGDTVLYELETFSSYRYFLKTVERTTKTMIVVWTTKFYRNGKERASGRMRQDHIFALTPENRTEALAKVEATRLTDELDDLANRLRRAQWNTVPLASLKEIAALLGWSE